MDFMCSAVVDLSFNMSSSGLYVQCVVDLLFNMSSSGLYVQCSCGSL